MVRWFFWSRNRDDALAQGSSTEQERRDALRIAEEAAVRRATALQGQGLTDHEESPLSSLPDYEDDPADAGQIPGFSLYDSLRMTGGSFGQPNFNISQAGSPVGRRNAVGNTPDSTSQSSLDVPVNTTGYRAPSAIDSLEDEDTMLEEAMSEVNAAWSIIVDAKGLHPLEDAIAAFLDQFDLLILIDLVAVALDEQAEHTMQRFIRRYMNDEPFYNDTMADFTALSQQQRQVRMHRLATWMRDEQHVLRLLGQRHKAAYDEWKDEVVPYVRTSTVTAVLGAECIRKFIENRSFMEMVYAFEEVNCDRMELVDKLWKKSRDGKLNHVHYSTLEDGDVALRVRACLVGIKTAPLPPGNTRADGSGPEWLPILRNDLGLGSDLATLKAVYTKEGSFAALERVLLSDSVYDWMLVYAVVLRHMDQYGPESLMGWLDGLRPATTRAVVDVNILIQADPQEPQRVIDMRGRREGGKREYMQFRNQAAVLADALTDRLRRPFNMAEYVLTRTNKAVATIEHRPRTPPNQTSLTHASVTRRQYRSRTSPNQGSPVAPSNEEGARDDRARTPLNQTSPVLPGVWPETPPSQRARRLQDENKRLREETKRLNNVIKRLHAEIKRLQKQEQDCREGRQQDFLQIKRLEDAIAERSSEFDTQVRRARQDNDAAEERIAALEDLNEALQTRDRTMQADIGDIEADRNDLRDEFERQRDRIVVMQEELSEIAQAVMDAESADDPNDSGSTAVTALNALVEDLRQDVDFWRRQVEQSEADVQEAVATKSVLQVECEDLRVQLADCKEDHLTLEAEMEALRDRQTADLQARAVLEDQVAMAQADQQITREQLEKACADTRVMQQHIQDLQEELEACQRHRTELEDHILSLESDNHVYELSVEEQNSLNDRLEQEADALREQADNLMNELSQADVEADDLRTKLQNCEARGAELEQEVERLREALENTADDVDEDDLRKRLRDCEAHGQHLQQRISEMRADLRYRREEVEDMRRERDEYASEVDRHRQGNGATDAELGDYAEEAGPELGEAGGTTARNMSPSIASRRSSRTTRTSSLQSGELGQVVPRKDSDSTYYTAPSTVHSPRYRYPSPVHGFSSPPYRPGSSASSASLRYGSPSALQSPRSLSSAANKQGRNQAKITRKRKHGRRESLQEYRPHGNEEVEDDVDQLGDSGVDLPSPPKKRGRPSKSHGTALSSGPKAGGTDASGDQLPTPNASRSRRSRSRSQENSRPSPTTPLPTGAKRRTVAGVMPSPVTPARPLRMTTRSMDGTRKVRQLSDEGFTTSYKMIRR